MPLYCKGRVLDAGAGHLLYKNVIVRYSSEYESLDFEQTHPELSYIADIQNMAEVETGRFDFVFCRNVLEHVKSPQKALTEIYRVLRESGTAIITVPHLGYLHNEPYDYWRFTKYSLREMAKDSGFEIVAIKELGGLFAFQGYVFQTVFLGVTYGIPFLGTVCFWMNVLIQKLFLIFDRVMGGKKVFPLNYLLIIKK